MTNKKEIVKNLLEKVRNAKPEIPDTNILSELGVYSELFDDINRGIENIIDIDSLSLEGEFHEDKIKHVDNFTLEDCCAFLKFLYITEGLAGFCADKFVESGDVLKILQRMYDLL